MNKKIRFPKTRVDELLEKRALSIEEKKELFDYFVMALDNHQKKTVRRIGKRLFPRFNKEKVKEVLRSAGTPIEETKIDKISDFLSLKGS